MASLRQSMLAYGTQAMAFSLISSSFNFYYVKVFLDVYHIEQMWFQLAQVLFLVWNAINDPLFAYLQESTSSRFTRTRRESILYGAPFFALSYVVPWFSWGNSPIIVGLHLIFTLFFWDTMLTFVGLATSALFTEISQDPDHRLKLVRIGSIGCLLGAFSVSILEFTSGSLTNFFRFQVGSICIGVVSYMLFRYTGMHGHTQYDREKMNSGTESDISHDKSMQNMSYWSVTWQILTDKNFLSFVVMNFFQIFHTTFMANFMKVIGDELIPLDTIEAFPWLRSFFYGSSRFLPMILVICATPVIGRLGYYTTIKISFVWKVGAGTVMYMIGRDQPLLLMVFLALDSCFATAMFSLFNMPLSDIVDTDMNKHHRSHPISSLVYGNNALVTKPAISLSPMMTVAVLNHYGYQQLSKKTLTISQINSLHDIMFFLLCIQPVAIGALQLVTWSFYSLRDRKSSLVNKVFPSPVDSKSLK
ncbi:transmembrane protein 180-like [Mizuhopecten yessoensis]|uniref:Transmembrane protein 180 n=1 Tax=Mizuhopecten yessoensis TaxID=6573 RepID=A0A210QV85_MIZYE|nr:transmembrane protein 180-like [Mizuhopecten yessoensis]OWF52637.1 Transmembrane protein 180 [Mizuhopecten yessoensis]